MTTKLNQQIIKQFSKKNCLAFKQIYEAYYKKLCKYAFGYVLDYEVARDLVQSMYVDLWESQKSIDTIEKLESFLYTSVKNSSINYIRKLSSKDKYKSFIIRNNSELLDENIRHENIELNNIIKSIVDDFDPSCKKVYELKLMGKKNKEIADVLSISIKTVEYHVSNFKRKIEKSLKNYFSH
jgi:RNA polymerase sigma-70 factor (ECF subfamily)